jgi:pseudaminic acid synthase
MKINGRHIGKDYYPYIIAELSANHNGHLNTALKLIEEAKLCGADAVKIQTYTADTMTLNLSIDDFQIQDGLWQGQTLYELYDKAHTPWKWHKTMFDYAKKLDITIFSSPFDSSAVDFLEDLNAPAYKIASFEAVDLALIEYVASTKKPMIISTGMASYDEIQEAISAAQDGGCKELALLHCVSGYPARSDEYNISTLRDMIEKFELVTGLSDHTLDDITSIVSIAHGASIIEKHFTFDRNGGGPDDSFSLNPEGLKSLCASTRKAWKALGKVDYTRKSSEMQNLKFRRSLYFVKDLHKGDVISPDSVRSIRPGFGLPPKYLNKVIGSVINCDVTIGTPVSYEYIQN